MLFDKGNTTVTGHVLIKDKNTDEILVDKRNAVHFENMSLALARSLANVEEGPIYTMAFGNGGSSINGLGIVTYLPPNTVGQNADLYNQTYYEIVDQNRLGPADNSIAVTHQPNALFTDLVITCVLGFGEPSGQEAFDDATDTNSDFVFDEIGLKTYNVNPEDGLLLTHVIFNPIQKSLNRTIEIVYTLRIQMC